jgi:hypothetical protein
VTLNGACTSTRGAAVSVDPVTATLPVAPGRVHSGVPPLAGEAVGQVLAAIGAWGTGEEASGSVTDDVTASAAEDVVADDVSASEPQAASVMTSDAADATRAMGDVRETFTVATLQTHQR